MKFLWFFFLPVCFWNISIAQNPKPVIVFASDTQEPMWVEKLIRKPDHNLLATKMIFADIDSLRPKSFFILGDVVSLGKRKSAWKKIDHYLAQMTKDSIPVYATLGNHEVMFNSEKGTRNFKARFPAYNPAGYTEVVDSVAVVLLNSNFSAMSPNAIAHQNNWYRIKLKELDND